MGVILDSSVLIAGERRGESVRQILERVQAAHGEVDSALSVVTIVELTHGIYRAKSDADRERRVPQVRSLNLGLLTFFCPNLLT
jgi:tRNA(fMet)-specific endonuclease VapC